jgi:D-xylose transport system permease protein
VALVGYLATGSTLFRGSSARLLIVGLACVILAFASYRTVLFSLQLKDGSTVGHWMALQKNLQDLPRVILFGAGLGQQGSIAAQLGVTTIGGGEGAIFSIAFQLGLPAALLFLWFYGNLARTLWHGHSLHQDAMSLAMFWLALGITPTLISSEHMLAVSGTGAFWLLCGATLRSLPRASHSVVGTPI